MSISQDRIVRATKNILEIPAINSGMQFIKSFVCIIFTVD
jgi:hypothetical protein